MVITATLSGASWHLQHTDRPAMNTSSLITCVTAVSLGLPQGETNSFCTTPDNLLTSLQTKEKGSPTLRFASPRAYH